MNDKPPNVDTGHLDKRTLGKFIRQIRESLGKTQKELYVGFPTRRDASVHDGRSTISRIENDINLPSFPQLEAIAKNLDMGFPEFMMAYQSYSETGEIRYLSLLGFVKELIRDFDSENLAEWQWEVIELAENHGLFEKVIVTEPCGEHCLCAEYYGNMDDGVECHRPVDWITEKKDDHICLSNS